MNIKNLREWLIYKKGEVSTAVNREATIGELMQVVELLVEKEENENKDH